MNRILALLLTILTPPFAAQADAVSGLAAPGVPPPLAREVAARAAERGIPAAEALAPIVEAAQRGVAPDLVAAKVLEGISKGVPAQRIAAVARDLADRLAKGDALLEEAQGSGLAAAADRGAAVLDLAAALGAGVNTELVQSLVEAARASRSGSADAVVSAAYTLGALAQRGVPPSEAMPLAVAISRKGPRPPAEIPSLFEAWRAEGGKDVGAFVKEAARRIEGGRKLEGMVDAFGRSPSRITGDRGPPGGGEGLMGSDVGKRGGDQGLGPAERADAARGAVPGLEDGIRGKAKGLGHNPNR